MPITNLTVIGEDDYAPPGWCKISTPVYAKCSNDTTTPTRYIAYELNGADGAITALGIQATQRDWCGCTDDPAFFAGWIVAGNLHSPLNTYLGFTRDTQNVQWSSIDKLDVLDSHTTLPAGWAWVDLWRSGNPNNTYRALHGGCWYGCETSVLCLAVSGDGVYEASSEGSVVHTETPSIIRR